MFITNRFKFNHHLYNNKAVEHKKIEKKEEKIMLLW